MLWSRGASTGHVAKSTDKPDNSSQINFDGSGGPGDLSGSGGCFFCSSSGGFAAEFTTAEATLRTR